MTIKFKVLSEKSDQLPVDILVVPVNSSLDILADLPGGAKKSLLEQLKKVEFSGRWAASEVFLSPADVKAPFVAVLSVGGENDNQTEGIRRGLAAIVKDARRHYLRRVAIDLSGSGKAELLTEAAIESLRLSNYRYADYSKSLAKEQKNHSLQEALFIVDNKKVDSTKKAVRSSGNIMAGVDLARHLVNQPAAVMSPRHLVKAAKDINKKSTGFSLKVLDKRKAAKEGFSAFLDVAKGSQEEPYVIHLTYKPVKSAKKKVVLVGKGITFDSGGLSLKPAEYMEFMKIDMAGAATVLGVMEILPKLKIDAQVDAIIPACENMPSGTAYRPGDILTARGGKTIEVINTDAEGRIILADALSYGADLKPAAMVDVATLTGACMVALGETYAGLFSNDKELRDGLLRAAEASGEGLSSLPLPEEYRQNIKSKVADIRNLSASRYGGAIAAAMFLEEFVNETPWAHIDIAGPSFAERECLPYYSYGATGYGVRTLVNWLKKV